MKYLIALFIFSMLTYAIPSNTFGADYPVIGELQTILKDSVSVVFDQQCGALYRNRPIVCSGAHIHYTLYHGVGKIMFRPWGSSSNQCFGVKVYSVDVGSHHQSFQNCYMMWCKGDSPYNIHINFARTAQNQIICQSSNPY